VAAGVSGFLFGSAAIARPLNPPTEPDVAILALTDHDAKLALVRSATLRRETRLAALRARTDGRWRARMLRRRWK